MPFTVLCLAVILSFCGSALAQDKDALSDQLGSLHSSINAAITDAAAFTDEDSDARRKIQNSLRSLDDLVGNFGNAVRSVDAAAAKVVQIQVAPNSAQANPAGMSVDDLQKFIDGIGKLLQDEKNLLQAEQKLAESENDITSSLDKIVEAERLIGEKQELVQDEYEKMADALTAIPQPTLSVAERLVKLGKLGNDFVTYVTQMRGLLEGALRDHVLKSTYAVSSTAKAVAEAATHTGSAAATAAKAAHDEFQKLGEQLTDRLARSGKPGTASMPAPASVSSILFVFKNEVTAGDCHMRSGARIQVSAASDGYDLNVSADMYTTKSLFGDVWHIIWNLKDASGNILLTSPRVDYPPNDRMHPQFGDQIVNSTIHVGPDAPPHIAQTLSNASTLEMIHSC
jgi:hypothetical protein